ncbi:MAG: YbaK/EbsC family protein [Bacillales bacterium]
MKNKLIEEFLNKNNIVYDFFEHHALLTMDDSYAYTSNIPGEHCKNLFLIDKKTKQYYHIVTLGMKKIDLKSLKEKIGFTSRTSFVSKEGLDEVLHLEPGCVNPLTMIFTGDNIHYFFDKDLLECDFLIFSASVVDESIALTIKEFLKFVDCCNKKVEFIEM